MKKLLLSIFTLLLIESTYAQWINKSVNNGFDDPYRICYTKESNETVLKLENVDGDIVLYLQGGYFCDDAPIVDISFLVNGAWKKYATEATKGTQSNSLFLVDDMSTSNALVDFLNATSVKLRVNESHCENNYYQFNMSGSTAAYKFISNY
jgi:hypothetical protein